MVPVSFASSVFLEPASSRLTTGVVISLEDAGAKRNRKADELERNPISHFPRCFFAFVRFLPPFTAIDNTFLLRAIVGGYDTGAPALQAVGWEF